MDSVVEKRDARLYELAVLTVSDKTELSLGANIEVVRKDGPKSVPLGYPIKKHESAYLTVYVIKASPEDAVIMEEVVRTNTAVLRHILITPPVMTRRRDAREPKADKQETKPSSPEAVSNAALEAALETIQGTNESK
ncbi:MAG: 30S ribosomal protein S6 [bacterium]|nr:30S ribosomal protein S6 [bacterium]